MSVLKKARAKAKITLKDLAKDLGCTFGYISAIENRHCQLTPKSSLYTKIVSFVESQGFDFAEDFNESRADLDLICFCDITEDENAPNTILSLSFLDTIPRVGEHVVIMSKKYRVKSITYYFSKTILKIKIDVIED